MPTHLLKWKPVRCKDMRGSDIETDYPDVIDLTYNGKLLTAILQMPRRRSVSFADAIRVILYQKDQAFDARKIGPEPGHEGWYSAHFVDWISSLGYHIELTGDEFDIVSPSQHAA